ncbi:MAG TPA: polysaccharide lyase family 8 super-sandwich domain-containing protein [Chitinophagaceae bacterium]|nr:polysaccharide lyase family 8 super-sandwich domain-containing protein [Chitinophagaceae bacterium]
MKNNPLRNSFWLVFISISFILFSYNSPSKIDKSRSNSDLEIIRKRIIDDLLEPSVNEQKIQRLIESINPDGSWPGINYKDTSRTGFQHSIHLENMLDLARAYKKQGTKFCQNAEVKKTVSSALDFWIAHDFICENWWWNEMGTPNWMINTMLALDDDLTDKQKTEGARIASRASLTGFGARAGGDFVPIAGMVVKQGLFKRNDSIVQKALKVMADQIKITTDRGIKPDLSFHHRVDNVTSIHSYGTNYVNSFAYWSVKTAGTIYKLPDEALKLLIDYYLDGICKSMAYGIYPDPGAKNRDLSRKGDLGAEGTDIPENLLKSSDHRKKELEEIIKVRKDEKKADKTWNRYYWWSSYFVHQRKNYFASVRMHSSRQNNVEAPYNEEGLKNHHLADGSNFLSRTGKEYIDIFPVWDWQKIPGTTVVQKPALPHWDQIVKKGLSDFVGGVSNGEFGVAAFDFKSVHDPLKARKAWFFFDREYVCLGAGIHSDAEYPVATTLNQCLLNKDVVVKAKNHSQTLSKGEHHLEDVSWVLHDSVGYFFPSPVSANIRNATSTGNWRQITHQSRATDESVQKEVFTLWLDHGKQPASASYAYIVVPGISLSFPEQYSKTKNIVILANSSEIQAVQNKSLNIIEIVFYQPANIKLGNNIILATSNPCIVMVKLKGRAIDEISVSDPTEKLTSLQLSINVPVTTSGVNWHSVWNKEKKETTITVDLPKAEMAGKTVVMKFGK